MSSFIFIFKGQRLWMNAPIFPVVPVSCHCHAVCTMRVPIWSSQ